MTKSSRERIQIVDVVKGAMILLMVGYHFLYDLVYFCGLPAKWFHNPVCDAIQLLICGSFIVCSGASARISRSNYRHALRIGVGAVLITVTTYVFDPANFVVFGILHFLATASLIYAIGKPFFDRIPTRLQPWLWGGTFLVLYQFLPRRVEMPHLWLLGFCDGRFSSSDYFPVLPWLALFLFGTWLGGPLFEKKLPQWVYRIRCKPLGWCGRQCFYIYLIHQPVLMAIVWFIMLKW